MRKRGTVQRLSSRPAQIYVVVTEETIEDNLMATLAAKRDLALARLMGGGQAPATQDSDERQVRAAKASR